MVLRSIGLRWTDASSFTDEWLLQRQRLRKKKRRAAKTIILFPADPDTLIGSKGDEAMLRAYLDQSNVSGSGTEIVALCRSDEAFRASQKLGFKSRSVWKEGPPIRWFAETLNDIAPDHVVIMGADIMDGFYHPSVSAERYAFADLASRANIATTILGFSFSARPVSELAGIIQHVDERVKFGLRDSASLQRWRTFCGKPARLVADIAFLLQPADASEATAEIETWISQERNNGRIVLGINVNKLVLESEGEASNFLLEQLALGLQNATDHAISWLLIPHDVREPDRDLFYLQQLRARLQRNNHYFVVEHEISAAQVKRIAGMLDGIITGRMHLAIAGLGMGIPVAGFGYLDKFEGLMVHFGIDVKYVQNLTELADEQRLLEFILAFKRDLSPIRHSVQDRLPSVMKLALKNLAPPSRAHRILHWISR